MTIRMLEIFRVHLLTTALNMETRSHRPHPSALPVRLSFETYVPGPSTARLGHGVGHVIPLRLKQPRRVSSGSAVSSLDGTVRVCLLESHHHREERAGLVCTMECCKCRHGFSIGPYASNNVSTRMTGDASMDAGLRVASSSSRAYLSWRGHDWAPTGPGTSVLGMPRVAQDAILIPWRFFISGGSQLEWVSEGARRCSRMSWLQASSPVSLTRREALTNASRSFSLSWCIASDKLFFQ